MPSTMRIFVVLFLVNIIIISGIHAKKDCKERLQRCENKKPPHRKQVCGSDNKTYPNRCALLREQCAQNSPLTVKHEGKCKEKQPCWMAQAKKVTKSNGKNSRNGVEYTPECQEDGTFAPVQCQIGYCYCVTSNGRIIPGTSARHRKIECPKRGRNNQLNGEDGGNSSRPGCDQTNRSMFTKNLVRIFKTEYNRRDVYGRYYDFPESHQNISNIELQAIEWKFNSLDRDQNNSLSKNEYKDLRGLIRKAVKPKRCSRKFIRLCDVDRNSLITKQEWINCLNISNTDREEENIKLSHPDDTSEDTETESEETDVAEPERDPASVLEERILPLSEHSPETEKDHESKINDCFSDRKSVQDEEKLGNQQTYIPECTEDGRYKKVQCYPSTGYCWCVMEDSGKPIPGASARNSTPNCDVIQNAPPPMEGCPDHKRIAFIKSLIDFFHRNTSDSTPQAEQLLLHDKNGHEQIVSRGFQSLDTNNNKALDRKEWKIFRSMVATINKNLKKCGRKFLRYCDVNQDKKVSISEWLQCTNTQNITTPEIHSSPSSGRRRGPNPLESYLKGDD